LRHRRAGEVPIWLDPLSRDLLDSPEFATLTDEYPQQGDNQIDDLRQRDHRLGPLCRSAASADRGRGHATRRSCCSAPRLADICDAVALLRPSGLTETPARDVSSGYAR
jgi:hypothetical protein